MNELREFNNVIVSVSSTGLLCLVCSPNRELEAIMDGCLFEDNSRWDTYLCFPKHPGVYSMTIEYQFQQGYSEGYPDNGESTWDFIPKDVKRIECP